MPESPIADEGSSENAENFHTNLDHAIDSLVKAEHFLVITRRKGEGSTSVFTYSSSDPISVALLTLYAQRQLEADMAPGPLGDDDDGEEADGA